MALRLEIISDQRELLGERSSIVFGVTGGSVGRALDNDWVLPDPQRYLSGHHLRIHFRDGAWVLEDTSTNGVFVNDAKEPVGRRGSHTLRSGDLLRLGEYRIQVNVETAQPLPPPGTGTLSQIAVERVTPLRAAGAAEDLGASLNIEALIPERMPRAAGMGAAAFSALEPVSAQQRLARLRAAARARLGGGPAALADVRTGLQAFCRGAGLDPSRLPVENEARALHLAGQLLREALLGLKEVLRAQKVFRDRYGIELDEGDERSPLSRPADDYLLELLQGDERHELDAVMQLRGSFSDASAHAGAVDPALRTALAQFLAHLAPGNVEARARDRAGEVSPAVVWERYRDVYMTLLHATGQELPHLFTEALAQAFRRELDNQSIETFKPVRE